MKLKCFVIISILSINFSYAGKKRKKIIKNRPIEVKIEKRSFYKRPLILGAVFFSTIAAGYEIYWQGFDASIKLNKQNKDDYEMLPKTPDFRDSFKKQAFLDKYPQFQEDIYEIIPEVLDDNPKIIGSENGPIETYGPLLIGFLKDELTSNEREFGFVDDHYKNCMVVDEDYIAKIQSKTTLYDYSDDVPKVVDQFIGRIEIIDFEEGFHHTDKCHGSILKGGFLLTAKHCLDLNHQGKLNPNHKYLLNTNEGTYLIDNFLTSKENTDIVIGRIGKLNKRKNGFLPFDKSRGLVVESPKESRELYELEGRRKLTAWLDYQKDEKLDSLHEYAYGVKPKVDPRAEKDPKKIKYKTEYLLLGYHTQKKEGKVESKKQYLFGHKGQKQGTSGSALLSKNNKIVGIINKGLSKTKLGDSIAFTETTETISDLYEAAKKYANQEGIGFLHIPGDRRWKKISK